MNWKTLTGIIIAVAVALLVLDAPAGPINPPAGPVGSTTGVLVAEPEWKFTTVSLTTPQSVSLTGDPLDPECNSCNESVGSTLPVTWTPSPLSTGGVIKAIHISSVRTGLCAETAACMFFVDGYLENETVANELEVFVDKQGNFTRVGSYALNGSFFQNTILPLNIRYGSGGLQFDVVKNAQYYSDSVSISIFYVPDAP